MASQEYLDKMQGRQNFRNLWHTDLMGTIQADTRCKLLLRVSNYRFILWLFFFFFLFFLFGFLFFLSIYSTVLCFVWSLGCVLWVFICRLLLCLLVVSTWICCVFQVFCDSDLILLLFWCSNLSFVSWLLLWGYVLLLRVTRDFSTVET